MREECVFQVFKNKELERIVGAKKDQEQRSKGNFNVILILIECLSQEMRYGEKLSKREKCRHNLDRQNKKKKDTNLDTEEYLG
jgi:hypothetical protein